MVASRPTRSGPRCTAHRVVGTPAAPVDEAGERELPNLELSGPVQKCEDRRSATHQKHDDEERSSAIKAFGKRAEKKLEQAHRKQTEHGHHRDQKRRIGALVDDNSTATVSTQRTVATTRPTYHKRQKSGAPASIIRRNSELLTRSLPSGTA
jgi:hypothetical protein